MVVRVWVRVISPFKNAIFFCHFIRLCDQFDHSTVYVVRIKDRVIVHNQSPDWYVVNPTLNFSSYLKWFVVLSYWLSQSGYRISLSVTGETADGDTNQGGKLFSLNSICPQYFFLNCSKNFFKKHSKMLKSSSNLNSSAIFESHSRIRLKRLFLKKFFLILHCKYI